MRTPTTLQQAIMDGLVEAVKLAKEPLNPADVQAMQLEIIENRILDYLRQPFTVAYLQAGEIPTDEILRNLAKKIGVENEHHNKITRRVA